MKSDMNRYNGGITREQFMFFEMRTTAGLLMEGLSDEEIVQKAIAENIYQYPTERMIKGMAKACLRRLHGMNDDSLIQAIASKPQDEARQICLYAMMKDQLLVCDFMLTVIGEKYRTQDLSFNKVDVNAFFLRLQEQDDAVATWSDQTIRKIGQVLVKILVDNDYLDNRKSNRLNPVLICSTLENALRANGDDFMLPAFNCFS